MEKGTRPANLLPEEIDGILRGEEKGGYKYIVICSGGSRLLYKKRPSRKELTRIGAAKSERINIYYKMPQDVEKGTMMESMIMNMRRLYLFAGEEMNKALRKVSY